MKKTNRLFYSLILLLATLYSCNKETKGPSDLEKIRNNTNKVSYPANKMDSAQAISFITKQKIQELLDLSTLYTSGNRDTEIDSVIYAQMQRYFANPDSTKLAPLLAELDSLNVASAKVGNLAVNKRIVGSDTLDFAKFDVEYFDESNRTLGIFSKNAEYILRPSPVKFKKEFKFYFVNFDAPVPNDSTAVGVKR